MNRSELFALVWAEPVIKVASRFSLSDRGFSKLCARHNIPLPERGYWAKVKAGQYPARLPLPRPDEDYEIALKGPMDAVKVDEPALALQSAMLNLFMGAPKAGKVAPEQPDAADADPVAEQKTVTQPVKPSETMSSRPRAGAGSGKAETTERLPPVTVPISRAAQTVQAVEAECQRAMAAGMEYQRRQAAQAFLGAVVANAYSLDEQTSTAVLAWARGVHERLSLVDPVAAVISEIRASSGKAQ